MAYEQLEPFAEDRADWRTAVLCCAFANVWRGKDSKLVQPGEIMDTFFGYDKPWLEPAKKPIDIESTGMAKVLSTSASKGMITTYQGHAPAIKRIGKRGKPSPGKRKLWRILDG